MKGFGGTSGGAKFEILNKMKLSNLDNHADSSTIPLLSEIINVDSVQSLMEDFQKLTGIGAAILDMEGKILVKAGWQEICQNFHRVNPESFKHCLESDTYLSEGVEKGSYRIYKCKNNLWDISTPIMLGEKKIGNLFLGQFFFDDEEPDVSYFRKQAKKFRFDEEAYLKALFKVKRLTREKVELAMSFYAKFAELISEVSYQGFSFYNSLKENQKILESLNETENKYATLVNGMSEGLMMVDNDDRILFANYQLVEITGYSMKEMIGKIGYELLFDKQNQLVIKKKNANRLDGISEKYKVQLKRKDGELIWVRISGSPVTDKNDKVIGSIGVITDLSDLVRAEEKLKEKNDEMEKFMYITSHDLRSPMVNIKGFCRELVSGAKSIYNLIDSFSTDFKNERLMELKRSIDEIYRKDIVDSLNHIDFSTKKIDALLEGLLLLSRQGTVELKMRKIDPNPIISNIILNNDYLIRQKKVETILERLPSLITDTEMFSRIFTNLIENAIKYLSPDRPGRIKISYFFKQKSIVFCVEDNGVGIDKQYHEAIFNLFLRLDQSNTQGEGLGLSVVKKSVQRLGGDIWLESENGSGTSFFVSLPYDDR